MILELDVGNTRVKWRLRHGARVSGRGACPLPELLAGTGIPPSPVPASILAACVRGAAVEQQLLGWAEQRYGTGIAFARVSPIFSGLTVAYAEPARLGVDRWLAMLAARHADPAAVCVIQCGSAITVDLVDGEGRHRGGLIAPGLRLMERSLLAGTDRVRFALDSGDALDLAPGADTGSCVRAGVSTAAIGLIERAWHEYRGLCPDVRALITGGDAERIAVLLRIAVQHQPELVLDGLALALPLP